MTSLDSVVFNPSYEKIANGLQGQEHDHATFKSVDEYVQKLGGKKVIDTVLIANNGIAAVKAIRSMRKWAYATFGNEKAIQFVVMATPEDLAVNAEYIRMADQIEEVPGGSNVNNYANVDLIVEIAERRGVHAVWAGWGHASENPRLPDTLSRTNVAFMGPPARAMHDLGDKIASTLIAQSANVSCVPWSGSSIKLNYAETGISEELYQKSCVTTVEQAMNVIKEIGLPVMVKASEGGGGKGIRKVKKEEDLEAAFRQVQGEVPGSPIFIMKMLDKCRHLEVQVIGDQYGDAISLYGRDCSVQRRHQKIIEEGPAIAAPEEVWSEMEQAAVRMARAVGYSGAGTIEYLFDEKNNYYFLELNPRLQVEHPVTELITNVNLPACQLNIAMGIPLYRIPDIRRLYGESPYSDTFIDVSKAKRLPPKGHVIAARITGENPDEGFKPTSGGIQELTFRSTPNVWGYFSVGANGGLHEYADSQFGHIFSRGNTREEARKELVIGLKELSIRGDISTPVAYVCYLLETDVFRKNQVTTAWLDRLIADDVHEEKPNQWLVVICGALFKGYNESAERFNKYMGLLERGQIPEKELLNVEETVSLIYMNTKYVFQVLRSGPNSFSLMLGEHPEIISAEVRPLGDGGLLILLNGKSYVCYGNSTAAGLRLILDGRTCVFTEEYDPSQLRSTTSGKLVRYLVDNGSHVKAGTPYAEMEVMKMYLPLVVKEPGKIHFVQTEGNIVEVGSLIATLELDDPSKVQKASLYNDKLPDFKGPIVKGEKAHQQLREAISVIKKALNGYYCNNLKSVVECLVSQLTSNQLPLLEFQETISRYLSRLPKQLTDIVNKELSDYRNLIENNKEVPFNGSKIKQAISKYVEEQSAIKQKELKPIVQPLIDLATTFESGLNNNMIEVISSLIKEYITVETFYEQPRENAIATLRKQFKDDLIKISDIERSHLNLASKNKLIMLLLEEIEKSTVAPYATLLHDLAELHGLGPREVSFRARRMLIAYRLPPFQQRLDTLVRELQSKDRILALVGQPSSIFDVLSWCFFHNSAIIRENAVEVYLRRAYAAYQIHSIKANSSVTLVEMIYSPPPKKKQFDQSLPRVISDDNLVKMEAEQKTEQYTAIVILTKDVSILNDIDAVIKNLPTSDILFRNLQIAVLQTKSDPEWDEDASLSAKFSSYLKECTKSLRNVGIRRITFAVCRQGGFPRYFTYRERLNYAEHSVYRHIEPPLSHHLELSRLCNYEYQLCPTQNHQIHLYYADDKSGTQPYCPRFFARSMIRGGLLSVEALMDFLVAEAENILSEACNALELTMGDSRYKHALNNHIFMNFIPEVTLDPDYILRIITDLAMKYNKRLGKAKVGEVELVGRLKRGDSGNSTLIRFVATNPTTYKFNIEAYIEVKEARTNRTYLQSIIGRGPLDGKEAIPYLVPSLIEKKRVIAHQNSTTYVYDFLSLFEEALRVNWLKHQKDRKGTSQEIRFPPKMIESTELSLGPNNELVEVDRPVGENDIGMVAWKLKLCTPEYPRGRFLYLLANDITFQIGSFGIQEDILFKKVSERARAEGIPRIYMAANSGARIGLAEELKSKFKVAWVDDNDPSKGFKYLYVTEQEYKTLVRIGSVNAKKISDDVWMVTDIIGASDGLGVENLRGSGMIAGETSRAYEETFTLTVVTGRTVGIGAYLVRLGQRTIQNKGPVILTGASALNKVLGRNVYSSNVQLGGTQIMFANGVSHIIVNDEIEGVSSVINWISYVPSKRGEPVPVIEPVDPINRDIAFLPTKAPYDPRHMIGGYYSNNEWISGFFDKDSFTETLAGWGKSVVVGRARLGGIPMGVIAVETRTVERINPADPALLDSHESVVQQAGQVWFPDSAYKTAQAIKDFNKGEELPLIIFANWRGFSGGLRDLYEEILKFGSYIVDNLRDYQQPVFIYIPPCGELRGGAWVVLDPTINPEKMEMYCDENGRGGVLEPNGTVEIKYKQRDVLKTMHRLDDKLMSLDKQLSASTDKEAIKKEISKREKELMSTYEQVAITFADLHDTPGRMKAKGCINEVLTWKTSRQFFYYRVSRRLKEEYLKKDIVKSFPKFTSEEAANVLRQWIPDQDDKSVLEWLSNNTETVKQKLRDLRGNYIKEQITKIANEDPQLAVDGLVEALSSMNVELRNQLLQKLSDQK